MDSKFIINAPFSYNLYYISFRVKSQVLFILVSLLYINRSTDIGIKMPQNATTLKTQIKDAELTSNINYLQPTGFRITIDRKRYPNLEYFCQQVVHPQTSVSLATFQTPRGAVPIGGGKMTFGSVEFSILVDENMESYKEMFKWLERLVNDGTVSPEQRRTAIPTHSDITLSILTSHNNTSSKVIYRDCIPTTLGSITFQSNGDGGYLTFSASFTYTQFEII
jgi:hypothetical protein